MRQSFERLKALGLIRRLGVDDFKALWDISEEGLSALIEVDPHIARVEPALREKRLNAPFETYGFDGLGLINRRGQIFPASGTVVTSGNWGSEGQFEHTESVSLSAARASAGSMGLDRIGVTSVKPGRLANACLEILEKYLAASSGAIRGDLKIGPVGSRACTIHVELIAKSADANIPEHDRSSLNELFSHLASRITAEDMGEDIAAEVSVSIRRKANGKIQLARLPDHFSISELTNRIRTAIVEVRPARLGQSLLKCRFGGVWDHGRPTGKVGLINFEWGTSRSSFWGRGGNRTLGGSAS